MSKRDLISEIQEKNSRLSREYFNGGHELYSLETSLAKLCETDHTLISLHITGVAACIEVGARTAIKKLIDAGSPFLERSEYFKDHIKFDFSLTQALSSGQITFGDLVSHSLPVSKLEHIASHLEVIFSDKKQKTTFTKLMSEVRSYVEPSEEEVYGGAPPGTAQKFAPFLIDNLDNLLRDVASIFEIRHIVAHEANFEIVSLKELSRLISSARIFLTALYELVDQTLNLGASRSGIESSIQNLAHAGNFRHKVNEIESRILEKISETQNKKWQSEIKEAYDAFEAYFEKELLLRFELHGMLTANAMRNIEADVTSKLFKSRITFLLDLEEHVEFYCDIHS